MNRDEKIEQLKQLQQKLNVEVDTFDIENRMVSIDELNSQVKENEYLIKYLSERLQNDHNYIDNTPVQLCNYEIATATSLYVSKLNLEVQNKEEIANVQSIIEDMNMQLEASSKEIEKLKDDNVGLEVAIRRAKLAKDDNTVQFLEKAKEQNEEDIQKLEKINAELKENIDKNQEELQGLESKGEELHNDVLLAEEALEKVKKEKEEIVNGKVDVLKKTEDEVNVEKLKEQNLALQSSIDMLSYDYAGKLGEIISDYENGIINDEQLDEKLTELKASLPKEFLEYDKEARNAELTENLKAQEISKMTIESLNRKLSDEANYVMSPEEIELNKNKVLRMKKEISSFERQIARAESENLSFASDLAKYQETIINCDENIDLLSVQIEINREADSSLVAELEEKRKQQFNIRKDAIKEIERLRSLGLANEEIIRDLQNKSNRMNDLLVNAEKKANDIVIDTSKRRLDELALTKERSGLAALQRREQLLNNSIVNVIDNLIGVEVKEQQDQPINENEEKIVFANFEDTPQKSTNDFEDDAKGSEETELPFPEEDSIDVPENAFGAAKGENNDRFLSPDDLETIAKFNELHKNKAKDIENKTNEVIKKIQEPITTDADIDNNIIDVQYTEKDIDENLRNKSKEPAFVASLKGWWKKHWRKAVLVAAFIAGVASVANNKSKNKGSFENPVPPMPTVSSPVAGETLEEDNDFLDETEKLEDVETPEEVEVPEELVEEEDKKEENKEPEAEQNNNTPEEKPTEDLGKEELQSPTIISEEYISGVKGDETVPENAWDNEKPHFVEDNQVKENDGKEELILKEGEAYIDASGQVYSNNAPDTYTQGDAIEIYDENGNLQKIVIKSDGTVETMPTDEEIKAAEQEYEQGRTR